jgi:2-dehydropantoate 2-reductase
MTSVLVVGVGAIGGVCAAHLLAAGRDVTCGVRTRFDQLVVDAPGGRLAFAPRVVTEPELADWVLLATKAHQTEGAAAWLRHAGRVAVVQNGVEHVERVSRWVPADRVVPVVIDVPATAVGPGRIQQRTAVRCTVPDDDNGRDFASLFAGTDVTVEPTGDWRQGAWRKLCRNVTGGALVPLSGRQPPLRHPRLAELAHALAHECVAVARAERLDIPIPYADSVARSAIDATEGSPSTLADRLRGRPLEYDARNGAVVRIGARHAVPTPVNARACELLARAHLTADDLLDDLAVALR